MTNKKDLTFEESIEALEASLARLESGELTLDGSLSEFEKAVGLVKYCSEKLEDAKQRVRILTEGADGAVTDVPFAVDKNEA